MALPLKQVAALPIVETARGPLVLLITTRKRGRWTIPRGWPKPGQTDADLAAQEAAEEAGVEGEVASAPLGSYRYTKRLHSFSWVKCSVDVYTLHVRWQNLDWPEKAGRKTRWVTPDEAASLVADTELAAILRDFFHRKAA
jgi:8-oxo-dGTP pyrophosphatase MutT (NUDIX family)